MKSYTRWQFLKEVSQDSSGLNLAIPAIFMLVTVITGLGGGDPDPGGLAPTLQDITNGSAAILAFAVALVLRRLGLRIHNIVVWCAAGALSMPVVALVDHLVRGHFSSFLVGAIPLAAVAQATNICIIGITFAGWRGTKKIRAALAAEELALSRRRLHLAAEIEEIKGRVVRDVRAELTSVVTSLNTELSAASTTEQAPERLANALMDLVDSAIRPLSHSLDNRATRQQGSVAEEPQARVAPSTKGTPATTAQLTSPAIYLAACVLFSASAANLFFGVPGLVVDLGVSLAGAMVQTLWFLSGGKQPRNRALRFWQIVVSSAAPSVAFTWFATTHPADAPRAMAMILGFFAISLFETAFLQVSANRLNAIIAQREANQKSLTIANRLQQEEWFERERLARVIHGQVQSKVLVAALRLQALESPASVAATLTQVNQDLRQAIDSLDTAFSTDGESVESQLASITTAWMGACDVQISVAPDLLAVLERDRVASACVIEVIREAVANAAKHSGATLASVQLTRLHEPTLELVVRSPGTLHGTGQSQPDTAGYGCELYSTLCTRWSLAQQGADVEFRATVELR